MTNVKTIRNARLVAAILAAALLALLLSFALGSAWANTTGHDDSLRVNDFTGTLSSDQEQKLSDEAKGEVDGLEFDFVVYITDKDSSADYLAEGFFTQNDYGYGSNNDGICLCMKPDAGDAAIYVSGIGSTIFSEKDVQSLVSAVKTGMATSCYDAVHEFTGSSVRQVAKYRNVDVSSRWPEPKAATTTTETQQQQQPATTAHTTDELSWYPKDPSSFVDFHDDNASRVVDLADLLTDEQEAQLTAKVADMRKRLGVDFVLLTDVSTYGLGQEVYAADFFQFNGYGVGDDYSGVIFFVCMDPNDRGFWTAACGGARSLLTEKNINDLDDRIYDYFVDGDYGTGILTEFDNLDDLYADGELSRDWTDVINSIIGIILLMIILGTIFGFRNLSSQRKRMKTIAQAYNATAYHIAGPNYSVSTDKDLGTTVRRVKRPKDNGGSGSGGGRSSYRSSYSSSGGRSFSGGGRKF